MTVIESERQRMEEQKAYKVNSRAKDLFVKLFCEAFGPEKAENLYIQYPFLDIYGNRRSIDFALENQQIFSYFKPEFTLGLTATPERADGENMLEMFQNVAHKMDLKTAVERGILAPIRCIRVKTDIDLSDVRINGVKYNSQDLESKLVIPERNNLIADTYLEYVNGRKTVIFCASINHAAEIARILKAKGVMAESVSSQGRVDVRNRILNEYENGKIDVLCACDLLNEGWDSPKTQVLFMARPTMSKVIYMQQLGREKKIVADMSVPIGETRSFNYYKEENIKMYAESFGWELITSANIVGKFMEFIEKMDMSYSYKPVLLKSMLEHADGKGRARLFDVASYFTDFYEERKNRGLAAEKKNSMYQKGGYSIKDVEKNVISNPFKRFADMHFMKRSKNAGTIEFNSLIFKKLTEDDKCKSIGICDVKLENYYKNYN